SSALDNDGLDSGSLRMVSGRFLFAWFRLLARDNDAVILRLNISQSFCLTEKGRHFLYPIRLGFDPGVEIHYLPISVLVEPLDRLVRATNDLLCLRKLGFQHS